MLNTTIKDFCGDIINTHERQDCEFQWFIAYRWYSDLNLEETK